MCANVEVEILLKEESKDLQNICQGPFSLTLLILYKLVCSLSKIFVLCISADDVMYILKK